MDLICKSCGAIFDAEDAGIRRERTGEEWATCPHCGCDDLMKYEEDEEQDNG